jgi:hypothetical protein
MLMELDFDKEIDALLRKARRDSPAGQGVPVSRHLDADELSAFAENAVPEASRAFYTAHLADCDSCRRTLVELNALNADAAPAAASESAAAAVVAETPWWKRLFAMPNLAYAMGVIVLLFSGLTGYLVFQRGPASRESQLARVTDERETYSSDSNANAAVPMMSNTANTSTNSVANTTSNNPLGDVQRSGVAVGSSSVPAETENSPEGKNESDHTLAANEPANVSPPPPPPPAAAKEKASVTAAAPAAKQPAPPAKDDERAADAIVVDGAEQQQQKKQDAMREAEQRKALRAAPSTPGPRQVSPQTQIAEQSAQNSFIFTRKVKGRTFEHRDGVWYDTDYTGGATTNVKRGTEEFKKLDDGLRSIAGKLDGTIVVIWKGTPFKIQ